MLILPYWQAARRSAELGAVSPGQKHQARSEFRLHQNRRAIHSEFIIQNSALPPSTAVRVLLADDHAMVRQGLRSILEVYPDVVVIGEAADGEEAVELARSLSPDVVVMDVNMAKMDGIEATRQIKTHRPDTLIVGLSLSSSNQVEPLLRQAGASSYVSKDAAGDRLYEALIEAMKAQVESCSVESPAMSPKRLPSPEGSESRSLQSCSLEERER